jgi:Ca2+-binding EF-hand superfamily protein
MRRCGGANASRAVPRASMFDLSAPKTHCEEVFAAIDANADRRISRNEFLTFIGSQPRPDQRDKAYLTSAIGISVASIDGKNPGQVFNRIDVNHDGFIDRAEAGLDEAATGTPAPARPHAHRKHRRHYY